MDFRLLYHACRRVLTDSEKSADSCTCRRCPNRLVLSDGLQGGDDRVTCHAFVLGDDAEEGNERPEPDWVVIGNRDSLGVGSEVSRMMWLPT